VAETVGFKSNVFRGRSPSHEIRDIRFWTGDKDIVVLDSSFDRLAQGRRTWKG
jgi:hypothetical protein